jgi:hypothetical protein
MREDYTTNQIKKHIVNAEKTTVDKSNSEFLFTRSYIDFNGGKESITVILGVDYLASTFKILPIKGDMFNFNYCKHESISMHKAILTVMAEAYEFGVKEISNVKL